MKSLYSSLAALMLLLALTPASVTAQTTDMSDEDMTQSETSDAQTIAQLAADNPDLSTLVAALQASGYDAPLSDATASWTVFAPTNEAFDALPAGVLDNLMKPENANTLKYILMYHVSPNVIRSTDIASMIEESDNGEINPETLHGNLTVSDNDGKVMITDATGRKATVTQADIVASNGIVHVIDKVLVPTNVDVSTLATDPAMAMEAMKADAEQAGEGALNAVKETGREVGQAVGNAADNVADATSDAYKATKEEVKETYNEVTTSEQGDMDDMDDNTTTSTMNRSAANTASMPDATIGEIAASNNNFSTLNQALKSAELEDLLNSNSQFTVFAPTNNAFSALPDSVSSSLMQAGNQEMLKGVLAYHVVASKISAADLMKAIEKSNGYFRIHTMGGGSLIASLMDGKVVLTDGNGEYATVTDTDIEASNGVIHVIDGVLTPRN